MSGALRPGVDSALLLGAAVAVLCCCCCCSTASVGSLGAASGFPLGLPLSAGLLFCRWTRLPGAARPLSFRLSCWDAAFFLPFATIEGGARASKRSPQVDSTAAQDEPVWKRGAAGRWKKYRRSVSCAGSWCRERLWVERTNENGSPDARSCLALSTSVSNQQARASTLRSPSSRAGLLDFTHPAGPDIFMTCNDPYRVTKSRIEDFSCNRPPAARSAWWQQHFPPATDALISASSSW